MTDLRKAAEMALESWDFFFSQAHPEVVGLMYGSDWAEIAKERTEALRQALAQPEQEPVLAGSLSVRYFRGDKAMTDTYFEYLGDLSEGDYTLYTAPPKREWVGLTDTEVEAWRGNYDFFDSTLVREVEAKLKEKNSVL